jgi:hypothetical protein
MANGKFASVGTELNIPTYLPLPKAARKYGLSEKVLTQLVKAGKIEAVQLPSGELLVPSDNGQFETKKDISAKEFNHLRRQSITVTEAAAKYSLNRDTVLEWVKREYIHVIKPGYRMELDEADVAYCAKIYRQKLKEYSGQLRGVTIFDEEGNPYQLIHPDLAKRRRQKHS